MINDHPGNLDKADGATVGPVVGSRITIYGPLEHQYYIGTLNAINDDKNDVMYDHDDMETIKFRSEKWQYV